MIADDISNWIVTLPKWQQKLSYLIMEKKHISAEELNGIYDVFKTETKLQSAKFQKILRKFAMLIWRIRPMLFGKELVTCMA